MYSHDEIWDSIAHEFHVIKHLATKIPAGKEHHKPTEKQRTTLELMQYISYFGVASFRTFLEGDYVKAFGDYKERAAGVTVENFGKMMDQQLAEMMPLYELFTEAECNKELALWGSKQRKGLYILNFLKMLAAYKMQLFLYAKHSGAHDIGTANVWAGMDMPPPKM